MSSAHICIRSVLTQAFRLSTTRAVAATVPDFLVPAIARCPRLSRRPFSSTCRRQVDPQDPALLFNPKPRRPSSTSKIQFPAADERDNVQAWLAAIDPYLPFLLRRVPSNEPDVSSDITPLDLAQVINAAQDASIDIIGYIGLVEERWATVVWIAKKLVENGKRTFQDPASLDPFANVIWPEDESRTLHDLTNGALRTQRARPSRKLKHTLDELTSMPDTINPDHRILKRALGQLWRSLGSAILVAAEAGPERYDSIMARVLEIIAHLHHIGFMPESVYTHKSNPDSHALQQPPTLHLLSTQILTALSDATWRAHEASVKVATERLNASYFLGHEIPGSRYKVKVTGIGPELWLELILWSCLHGGWLLDGSAILQEMLSPGRERAWRLISWRELLQAKEIESAQKSGFGLFQRREDAAAQPEDRAQTERTISSEVVTAFVDGLVNDMRLGVGARGTAPEDLVKHIKMLKHSLDMNKLSLGSTTWDSIISRLLESGGIVPEKRPGLLLSILDLASAFGTEVSSVNATSKEEMEESEPPYFYEPTTIPLNLLHRTLRSFITYGDMANAVTTLKMLQQFTDSNKQKSLEQFFETLKTVSLKRNAPFTSTLSAIEFPAFDTQLPVPLLAKLLDLVTETKMYDLGRYLLFSEDLDGPLIPDSMYGNWAMAASIIRFGTMAGENDLVSKVVERTANWNGKTQTHRMPHEYFTALLTSQIKLHRWKSVRGMQEYVLRKPGYKMQPEILATMGAELLRSASTTTTTSEEDGSPRARVCHAFTDFLYTWENLVLTDVRNEFYSVLAMVSTVSEDWRQFCGQFIEVSARQRIKMSTGDFNHILSGVVDGYGSIKGRDMVDMWCYKPPKTFEPYRAPGGLPTMAKYRPGASDEYEGQPDRIDLRLASGARLVLKGRVHPSRWTIQVILRKMQQEQEQRQDEQRRQGHVKAYADDEVGKTVQWARRLLYYLGFDDEDIVRDLGSLACRQVKERNNVL